MAQTEQTHEQRAQKFVRDGIGHDATLTEDEAVTAVIAHDRETAALALEDAATWFDEYYGDTKAEGGGVTEAYLLRQRAAAIRKQ